MELLLTCEHGGNEVPQHYRHLFLQGNEQLQSHRGWDPGALDLFRSMVGLASATFHSTTTRLLVELNRSPHHRNLLSQFTRSLSQKERTELTDLHYWPYRKAVEQKLSSMVAKGPVFHLSVHSFTPELNSEVRNADIGLLYDPSRGTEKLVAHRWKELILLRDNALRVRYNYPYRGTADGFTTYLRKKFPRNYTGIELEVNQKHCSNSKMDAEVARVLVLTLGELLADRAGSRSMNSWNPR